MKNVKFDRIKSNAKEDPFLITSCTPVLANRDKVPTLKAGKTVPVRNGINPANAGK